MSGIDLIARRAPLVFQGKELALYNIERVRSYLENNLGCSRKEVCRELDLCTRTVSKAIRIIRGQI